ncbi:MULTISPECIES: phage tail protein [unclassified Amycolatopsis]|jgi:phage tail-like protein|uniref:phage tail protein n=1 Tax=unclassified Amycolatopsis TaxID=2618356 RepID=UPI002E1CF080|nr:MULTISPECIES: phage tail protein [unclassified Amycolatopsis]
MAIKGDDKQLLAMANRFKVVIDQGAYDLGSWSKVTGLDVTWDVAEYRAGDSWNHRWYYPGNTKYQTIKLERAACKDTNVVKKWLNEGATKPKFYTGTLKLYDANNDAVTEWELRNVVPAKWSIAGFEAGSSKVALETLELQHLGFLDDEQKAV